MILRKSRWVGWLGVILIGVGMLFTEVSFGAEPVTIKVWTMWTKADVGDLTDNLVKEFETTHPNIKVDHLIVGYDAIVDKTRTAIAGGDPPDVATVWTRQAPGWADAGLLTPLDTFMTKQELRELQQKFFPNAWNLYFYKGRLIGLTNSCNSYGLYWNKARFREAGLNPERGPRTIAELDRYAEKLTEFNDKGEIKKLGFLPWYPEDWIWTWGWVFGGDYYDAKTQKITANNPKVVQSFEWKLSYVRKYGLQRITNFCAGIEAAGGRWVPGGPMYDGTIAMYYTGEWHPQNIAKYGPKMEYGVAPLPYPPGGRAKTSLTEGNFFIVPKGAKHPKEAWEFIKWFCSEEATEEFDSKIYNVPPLKSVAYKPGSVFTKWPMNVFVDIFASPNGKHDPYIPVLEEYITEMGAAQEAVIYGKKTPKEALDYVTQKIQTELDKYLKR